MILTLGAATEMLGVLLRQILGISRMIFAMGSRKNLFPCFQKVHQKYQVPYIKIIGTGVIISVLCIWGTFEFIIASAAFTILLYYSITNKSALKQPAKKQRFNRFVAVVGLIGCLLLAFSLDIEVII